MHEGVQAEPKTTKTGGATANCDPETVLIISVGASGDRRHFAEAGVKSNPTRVYTPDRKSKLLPQSDRVKSRGLADDFTGLTTFEGEQTPDIQRASNRFAGDVLSVNINDHLHRLRFMAIKSSHNPRIYAYVGPADIKARSSRSEDCKHIACAGDVALSLKAERQTTFAFVIDAAERLWVADRRSEHVACADGQDVLAAGEVTLDRSPNGVVVSDITNQSTGYCPEPACWTVVARVLNCIGLPHPPHFTQAFEFRRCEKCQSTNLVKDSVFECAVCGAPLSHQWNYE